MRSKLNLGLYFGAKIPGLCGQPQRGHWQFPAQPEQVNERMHLALRVTRQGKRSRGKVCVLRAE
jgi:hypothetical protein